jgi:hypothetical protein
MGDRVKNGQRDRQNMKSMFFLTSKLVPQVICGVLNNSEVDIAFAKNILPDLIAEY